MKSRKVLSLVQELAQKGKVSAEQLKEASDRFAQKEDISQWIVEQSILSQDEFNQLLAAKAGVKYQSLEGVVPDSKIIGMVAPEKARRWRLLPLEEKAGHLILATSDPFDLATLDEARSELRHELDYVLVSAKELDEAILKHYGSSKKASTPIPTGAVQIVTYEQQAGPKSGSQEAAALANQVVSSVDQLLQAALHQRASDIHLEPTRQGLKIRFRIDGVLEQFALLPPNMQESILSRIKIMGSMDVAEHRISQDGRTRLRIGDKEFDIRIATYPTLYGEAAAIRMLSKDAAISLDSLGFSPKDRATFEKMIHKPHGIILVTGPTGSGKTTTLYTALQNIDRNKSHVLSVEDPIENEIDGVDQTQINTRAGVTFATALRAMLRQDPDVIMVGEIRDRETAEISLGAAMTGHLVLSTLHTNTAIGAIARLQDLGIETYLISATLLGVIAQRLVRRVCQSCKEEIAAPRELIMALGPRGANVKTYQGKGCPECDNRGFKGRIGLYEFVEIDEEFRVLINNHAPDVRLREKAAMSGFRSILEDGIEKINQGLTTIEEVIRVCGAE